MEKEKQFEPRLIGYSHRERLKNAAGKLFFCSLAMFLGTVLLLADVVNEGGLSPSWRHWG
jgi:hypothetical protein